MTLETSAPTLPPAMPAIPRKPRGHLVRAELLKIFTTRTWWILGLIMLGFTALSLLINVVQANTDLTNAVYYKANPPTYIDVPADQRPSAEQMAAIQEDFLRMTDIPRVLAGAAANVYTSGQLLNLMFIVVLGALIVTNEFFHQTATSTFLTTPQRTRVILAKLAAAVLLAAAFWAIFTALNVGIGALNFASNGYGVPFGQWEIIRSVLMNLLAYVIWAVLGVGLGVLIQSQLGATITGVALYWISWPIAAGLLGLIREYVIKDDWVYNLAVALPGVASFIMVSTERLQFSFNSFSPPWWVGALVLLGYGVIAGVVGTLITRRRDIS
jgi:ABC-2 type transport system permease protein